MGENKAGTDLETLKRVIEEGKQRYKEGISYEQWYHEMIMENGTYARPYLRETWKHLKHGTCPDPQPLPCASRFAHGGRFHSLSAMWEFEREALAVGAVCGFVVCLVLGLTFGIGAPRQGRFILVRGAGVWSYKMDTRTGQTWLLNQTTATPVESLPR